MNVMQEKVGIPEISEADLRRLAEKIKPLARFGRDGFFLCYIKPVGLGKVADELRLKPTKRATDVVPFCEMTTWHNCGFPGFSRPSVEEVIAQIHADPELDQVVAYEILQILEGTEHDDLNGQVYYRAITKFYTRA